MELSLYLDKHSTYKSTAKSIDEMLSNTKPLSEFERAMKEFCVKVIHDSPWTFQDTTRPAGKGNFEYFYNGGRK